MEKLFVYGNVVPVKGKPAKMVGSLYDLGDFPAFLPRGDTEVYGTVVEIPTDTLCKMDVHEAQTRKLFARHKLKTTDGDLVWVYMYTGRKPRETRKISEGIWHRAEKK